MFHKKWKGFYLSLVMVTLIAVFPNLSLSATLHVVIAADTNDRSVGKGTEKDLLKVTELYNSVSNHTGMRLNLDTCYGNRLNKSNVLNALDILSLGSDDVAVFHYSGHGGRTRNKESRWPYLALDRRLDLDDIVSKLREKNPRFFIAMSDSCNSYSDSIFSQNFGTARPKAENYQKLFLKYRGHIIASGSVPGEYSWTSSQYGGKFTHAFLTSLHKNLATSAPSWHTIMENVQSVIHVTDKRGKQWEQHPQAEVNVTSLGKRPQKTETFPPAVVWIPPKLKIEGGFPSWNKIFPTIANITPPNWDEIFPNIKITVEIWNNRFPPGMSSPDWNSAAPSDSGFIKDQSGKDVRTLY
ncbi:caspase family protein [Desulfonema magnum]|uniref:Caspase domain-containing protein n=1 Tax=Desulfonema magnum TaxID=45655 RepID=A0A975BJK2_9BACT|nr:caspase family protein [Desulfonema magnum]QTA86523.1 Caspase domain-containing protein [Desulfonema magnum]